MNNPDQFDVAEHPLARATSVVDAFSTIARDHGDRVALRCGELEISYRDLDQQTLDYAARLTRAGIEPGDRVGVEARRSIEAVVAMLSILRAGAAYVPLPDYYPTDRLEAILQDASLTHVIGALPGLNQSGIWCGALSDLPEAKRQMRKTNLSREMPAYVMFTSGSTGVPKGVVVPHRAILRLVIAPNFMEISPQDRFLQLAPLAFDAATLEIWGALLNGATLVIPERPELGLRELGDMIRSEQITSLWLTAGLFHAMAEERPADFAPLRQLIAGGDVLRPDLLSRVRAACPELVLINGYGPTENTTFTLCHRIRDADLENGQPLPVGKPISGTDVFIVDDALNRLPQGERGELVTSGEGLALGYLGRDDLTEAAFVAAPWDKSLRLYRTGDLVSRDADGVFHFHGRQDRQVKIRGFRVELNAVEAALGDHPGISAAAVALAEGHDSADRRIIGFYVAEGDLDEAELRRDLKSLLPDHAVPAQLIALAALPLTESGKIDRKALIAGLAEQAQKPNRVARSRLETDIADIFSETLGVAVTDRRANFFDLGASSLQIARAHERLQVKLGRSFPITDLFAYSSVAALAEHLGQTKASAYVEDRPADAEQGEDLIAIVGMAGRFPGAASVAELWDALTEGRELISHFAPDELEIPAEEGMIPARGLVDGADLFDARHFGIPPKEAERLDPQHRLLLEVAQTALEDAGHDPDRFDGRIGVFAGMSQNSYLMANLLSAPGAARKFASGYPVRDPSILFGNDKDFMTTRIAYKLNLRGPALNLQCACSTSLVAVSEACDALIAGRADMALAGGVSITFPQRRAYAYTPDGMASADGHCRTFDADASGTVFGDGAGLVALRRLSDAERDGDDIIAVIRGFAINNDGAAKAGYAAPSVIAQANVIRAAHAAAKVSPDQIGYVEAHGTGTALGDPIEFAGLRDAFGPVTPGTTWLGTAKTNIGHLDIAAGVTGLIKTALTLKHGKIPPLLHYRKPNKAIDFETSPFRPVTALTDWARGAQPRLAGVSAFGVGGTNIHMVLQEAPEAPKPVAPNLSGPVILPLSATSKPALKAAVSALGAWAEAQTDTDGLAAVAKTLRKGRREYPQRVALVAQDMADLAEVAKGFTGPILSSGAPGELVWLFPGQGSQHVGMGRALYEAGGAFAEAMDTCDAILQGLGDDPLTEILYCAPEQEKAMTKRLRDTALAQPAIFALSYALAKQWQAWDITPDAMIGHSVGEFVAATLAGVMELEDALGLVRLRGRLMSDLPGGSMISVAAPEADLERYLRFGLDVASVNGPKATVLAGDDAAVDRALAALEKDGIAAKRLHTSHAFHSRMMDPAVIPFRDAVAKLDLKEPQGRILSTVTAEWMTEAEATDPGYWAGHMRAPVRFFDALLAIKEKRQVNFLEVGPGRTLSVLAGQTGAQALASQPHATAETADAHRAMLEAFGGLWAMGYDTDWAIADPAGLDLDTAPKAKLPGYCFQRERFWVEPWSGDLPIEGEAREVAPAPETAPEPVTLDPLTAVQEMLSDLSGIPADEIEPDTSFLALGFDSLLLTQATKEISDSFGLKVTLRQLMDDLSTPGALAAQVTVRTSLKAAGAVADRVVSKPATPDPDLGEPASPNVPMVSTQKARAADQKLTPAQRTGIDRLVRRFTEKTAKSKALTVKHRPTHADPRTASGFNLLWKELVYQIVTVESKGSRLLDIDGNEYIDILNGFGPGFLGHGFDPVVDAVHAQLDAGFEVGPQSLAAMESAALFAEVTGNERASFMCTGSEAVYAAMRLARTCTGRDKIVFFARDYHGNFDEVIARGMETASGPKTLPMAPGIPRDAVKNIVVLPYGTDQALDYIRANASDLAAVMVEPVQSRRPEFRPRDFIREVREITRASETLFIFDEVVTGFRFGPRGAQQFYGVDADLVTYGKVVGGGMPLGVVSGKARYMDTFDGGQWDYGDRSMPEAPVTFFAGTFVRHPLVMASLKAMLTHFKSQPAHFWKTVNAKGDRLAGTLDNWFRENDMPFEFPNCGSLMYLRIAEDQKFGPLLGAHMRDRGVFFLEGFPSYMTAAHDQADIDYVIDAVKDSALEMRSAGLLTGQARSPYDGPKLQAVPPRLKLPGGKAKIAAQMAEPLGPLVIPTTEGQREILAAMAVSPELSPAYNESITIRLTGEVDIDRLQRACAQAIARHDALQGVFSADGTEFHIASDPIVVPRRENLTYLDPAKVEARLDEIVRDLVDTPFDMEAGPLMRVVIAATPMGADLILCGHHAVFDGWSVGVLSQEIGQIYRATTSGPPAELEAAPSYTSFQNSEATWAGSDQASLSLDFWAQTLSNAPASFDLPTDRPRAALRDVTAERLDLDFDAGLVARLRKVAAGQGATLVHLFLTAFKLHLARVAGGRDVTVTMPAAGQSDRDMPGLVGHCVNLMPVRSQIDARQSFGDLLKTIRGNLLDAYDNQRVTYGALVRDLDMARDPARLPLTSITFNMDRYLDLKGQYGPLGVDLISHPRRADNAEIFLNLTETAKTVTAEWTYRTALFDPATMHRHMAALVELLERIAADPDCEVMELLAVSGADRKLLLEEWQGSEVKYPSDRTLGEVFAERVASDAARIALIDGSREVSYAELDRIANAVAARMAKAGVTRGSIVALLMDRSVDFVASIIAAFKLDAAYLPLATNNPVERVNYMIEDAKPACVVTTLALGKAFGLRQATTLDDLGPDEISAAPSVRSRSGDPDGMAYIPYTSGSTGKPKGVMATHRATLNRFYWMWRVYPFKRDEVMCQKTSISFGDSIWEILGPLLGGVPQVIFSDEVVKDPELLVERLGAHKITRFLAVPSLIRAMIDSGIDIAARAPKLRYLFLSGEAMPVPLARSILEALPDTLLVNLYGSSEVAADVTVEEVTEESMRGLDSVPIGRPLDNIRLYVLDEDLQLVAPGDAGELYVGGAAPARGYLHRPDLSDERFLPDPFVTEPAARMFRTGDLVRFTEDGRLMFEGRGDSQVKLRGFRIELGEIDAALLGCSGVASAITFLRDPAGAEPFLVSFVTGESGAVLDDHDLRDAISQHLAPYMVPQRIVVLEKMPHTPSGKIDRMALSQMQLAPQVRKGKTKAPQGPIELRLQDIWCELLSVDRVSRDDSFFELGGHSLLAVRLFTRISEEWALNLPISTLFLNPSLRELAHAIEIGVQSVKREDPAPGGSEPWDTTVVIHPGPGSAARALFVASGVGGNVNNLYSFGQALGAQRPVIGLQMRGIMGHDQHETVEATATDHIRYIRAHQPRGPYLLAGYSGGAFIAYEIANQLRAMGEEVGFFGIFDMFAPGYRLDGEIGIAERVKWETSQMLRRGPRLFMSRAATFFRKRNTDGRFALAGEDLRKYDQLARDWWQMVHKYQPKPYAGDADLFVGIPEGIRDAMMLAQDPDLGWRQLIDGQMHRTELAATHREIFEGAALDIMVRTLNTRLKGL